MSTFLEQARALYTKPESNPGVWADPTDSSNNYTNPAVSDVRIRELDFKINPEVDDENSKYLNGTFVGDEAIVGKIKSDISYSIKFAPGEFGGTSSPYTHKLNYDEFLASAGLLEEKIYDNSASQELKDYKYPAKYLFYPTTDAAGNTLSQTVVDKTDDNTGIQYDLKGSVNNLTISADGVGKPLSLKFEGAGGVEQVIEVAPADMKKIKFDASQVMETVASKFLSTDIIISELDSSGNVALETTNPAGTITDSDESTEPHRYTIETDKYTINASYDSNSGIGALVVVEDGVEVYRDDNITVLTSPDPLYWEGSEDTTDTLGLKKVTLGIDNDTNTVETLSIIGYKSHSVCANKFELQTGNQTVDVDCQADVSGLRYMAITGMQPRLSFNPLLAKLSDFDFFKALTKNTAYRIEFVVNDTDANGNEFKPLSIVVPRAQLLDAPISADNGFLRSEFNFRPLGNKHNYFPTIQYTDNSDTVQTYKSPNLWDSANSVYHALEAMYYITIEEETV